MMFGVVRIDLVEPTILARLSKANQRIKSNIKEALNKFFKSFFKISLKRRSSRLFIIKKKGNLRILLIWVGHVFLNLICIAKLNLTEKLPPEHRFRYTLVSVKYALTIYICGEIRFLILRL